LHWTVILAPLVLLPLVIISLGFAWMLAALGVFLRDVGQTIGIFTTVMMFMSPVFFPITAMPEQYRPLIMANPLTFIIEQAREVLIWGTPRLVGRGYLYLSRHGYRLARLHLVSKNQKRLCRCFIMSDSL